ncbi:hypothetical protein GCM10022252_11970 [Streptosporangium oxazolinicum]|uniref:Uncharacterized protein n=1 Tax=Streptosporangium oxazolinicum TaxID=909287 RepID=A0ABP8AH87_9ACTN
MNRTAKLSGALATLGMAAGLLFTPAAASADAEATLASPVTLRFADNTTLSRNAPGTVNFLPKLATTVSGGTWSGYVQYNDGSRVNFCPSQTVNVSSKPSKALFVSSTKGSWCP